MKQQRHDQSGRRQTEQKVTLQEGKPPEAGITQPHQAKKEALGQNTKR
ncbi:MAG: hypothetical protein LIO58_07195 [Oscillospiraceae bacterium]|nr:hypothetical protein [Oscillospiraceae bacterium]